VPRAVVWNLVCVCIVFVMHVGAAAGADRKLIVDSARRDAAEYLIRQGARVVAERGSYRVLAADPRVAARVSTVPGITVRDDFDYISFRRMRIDTRLGRIKPSGVVSTPAAPRRLKVIQFGAPPSDADLERLAQTGAAIVHYVPQNAFVVWTPSEGVANALKDLAANDPAIQFYDDYQAAYALSPALDDALARDDQVKVTVQLFNHAASSAADLGYVQSLAAEVLVPPWEVLDGQYTKTRPSLTALLRISSSPGSSAQSPAHTTSWPAASISLPPSPQTQVSRSSFMSAS
jgi:hypothetical protein